MLFINVEDFYQKAAGAGRMSREEEKMWGARAKIGDRDAQERIVESYLPAVAFHMKRLPRNLQTLELIYRCVQSLEKAAADFDFTQDSKRFSRRLNWSLRQTSARYIAERT